MVNSLIASGKRAHIRMDKIYCNGNQLSDADVNLEMNKLEQQLAKKRQLSPQSKDIQGSSKPSRPIGATSGDLSAVREESIVN